MMMHDWGLTPLRRLFAALSPSACLLCGSGSGNDPICAACAAELPALPRHDLCPCCAENSPRGELCGRCLRRPPAFSRTYALWRYAFPADRLIQALKYQHRLPLAGWLGQQLATAIDPDGIDRVMPLPLHPQRLRERGFNQAALIAGRLGKCLGRPVDRDSLQRTRATPAQASQPYRARQANVRGAFESRSDLSGLRILLVDDVMTTGATLREAARVLCLHGAAEVRLAVVARALHDDHPQTPAALSMV